MNFNTADSKNMAVKVYESRPKYSNLIVDYKGFIKLLDDAYVLIKDQNCFILIKHDGFYKFYYLINDYKALASSSEIFEICNEPVIMEIPSKTEIDKHKFLEYGFKIYKTYSRYKSNMKNKFFDMVKLANISDVDKILYLINSTFDPLGDHLPSKTELINLILNKEVFTVKVDEQIAGVSIYEGRRHSTGGGSRDILF